MKRVFLSTVLLLLSLTSYAAPPRAVVLVVPGLRSSDLTHLTALEQVMDEGGAGWMVCRSASGSAATVHRDGRNRLQGLLLTLAAGSRAPTLAHHPEASQEWLTAGSPWRMPKTVWVRLTEKADRLGYPCSPGLLADLLQQNGVGIEAEADAVNDTEANGSVILTADSEGSTSSAYLTCTKVSQLAPLGVTANIPQILHLLTHSRAGLHVITFWMLQRADRSAYLCSPAVATMHSDTALHYINVLWQGVWNWHINHPGSTVMILSPGPAHSTPALDRLSPIFIAGPAYTHGILSSPSTRRNGLVVNTDLLPTLLKIFQVKGTEGLVGRPMFAKGPSITVNQWVEIHSRLYAISLRQDLFGGLPTLLALLLIACCFALWKCEFAIGSGLLTAAISLPVALLLLPLLPILSVYADGGLIGLALLIFFLAGSMLAYGLEIRKFLAVCLLTTTLVDLFSGSHLMHIAWMSYSVMEAARYTGIGNEMMGAVFGALLMLSPSILKMRHGSLLLALISGLFTLAMVWPEGGAKVGALPVGIITFGLLLASKRTRRFDWRAIPVVLIVSGAVLALVVLWDIHLKSRQRSQLGRAFQGDAGGSVLQIAQRKLLMEGHLLLHSPWSLAMIAAVFLLWKYSVRDEDSSLFALKVGTTAGALSCLLMNDAGVAASAILLTFTAGSELIKAIPNAKVEIADLH